MLAGESLVGNVKQ